MKASTGVNSLIIALSLMMTGAPASGASAESEHYRHAVTTVPARQQDSYTAQRRFSGRALASRRAELGFEFDGKVERLLVDEGDLVEPGAPLVVLDTDLLDIERQELRARLAEIDARLANLNTELARHRQLQRKGYSAQQQVDNLEAEGRALSAQRERTLAQLEGVELRRKKSTLKAPFAGEIVRLDAERGVVVEPGRPVLLMVETAQTEAVIGIPASLKRSLAVGDPATVSGAFGQTEGTVLSISATVDPKTLTHLVRVRLPQDLAVADSSIVYLLLEEERRQAGFWLPMNALVEGIRGTWAVYAVHTGPGGQQVLEKHSVEPVHQQAGQVYVRASLADGTRVVAGGVHRLAPGQKVTVRGE